MTGFDRDHALAELTSDAEMSEEWVTKRLRDLANDESGNGNARVRSYELSGAL